MKKKSWIRIGLPFGLLLLSVVVRAQQGVREGRPRQAQRQHSVRASLDTVVKTGFYRIVLPPDFVARCRTDLSDLRIFKPTGEQVPYVLRTGIGDSLNAGWLSLPDPLIRRRDSSNKHSYYWLQYDNAYRIERLSFVISNPVLYKRTVRITAVGDSANAGFADVDAANDGPVVCVSIDPHDTAFRILAIKARTLLIDIANGDNAPLAITRAASAQSGIYILTWLQSFTGNGYELEAGENWASPPDYDLHYFTDSLRRRPFDIGLKSIQMDSTRVLGSAAVKPASPGAGKDGEIRANRKSGLLLWGILIFILLLLIYVSMKLARAVSQKEKNDRL
ncbi:MAG TPA: hypothetical protein VG052_07770 [Puia sp.]|nr:hypothetical protein [Puia sp.]